VHRTGKSCNTNCIAYMYVSGLLSLQKLQDAAKNKFSKCEHIDLDWGVGGEGDEEIYQTPILEPQSATMSATPAPFLMVMKRSDTSGNLSDKKGKEDCATITGW